MAYARLALSVCVANMIDPISTMHFERVQLILTICRGATTLRFRTSKIAHRLEHFISLHIHGKTPNVYKLLQAAESRLAVKLSVDGTSRLTPVQLQHKSAVLSLAVIYLLPSSFPILPY